MSFVYGGIIKTAELAEIREYEVHPEDCEDFPKCMGEACTCEFTEDDYDEDGRLKNCGNTCCKCEKIISCECECAHNFASELRDQGFVACVIESNEMIIGVTIQEATTLYLDDGEVTLTKIPLRFETPDHYKKNLIKSWVRNADTFYMANKG